MNLPRVKFLGLGQSSEAGEQERRQVLRLVLAWSGLASSLTQRSPSHFQLQGSWAAALSKTKTSNNTAGESSLPVCITDTLILVRLTLRVSV